MKSIILDTNAYSFLALKKFGVVDYLDQMDTVYMSCIVLGELYLGFLKGIKQKLNEDDLVEFLEDAKVQVCDVDQKTARIYSEVGYQLKKIGKPIPTNDMWIAAQAMRMDAELVTFDGHFKVVKGLRVWEKRLDF